MRTRLLLAVVLGLGAGALGLFAWFAAPGSLPDAAPAMAAAVEPARPVVPVRDAAGAERAAVETPEPEDAVADAPFSAESKVSAGPDWERATLAVRVTDAGTGAPLGGVRLILRPAEQRDYSGTAAKGSEGDLTRIPVTDAGGRATFRVPPGVACRLDARAAREDVRPLQRTIAALSAGERREVSIALQVGADLRFCGRVVRADDGTPIAGARVRLLDALGEARDATESDPSGGFEVLLRSWDGWHGRVDADGFGPALFAAVDEHETPDRALRIELRAAAGLRGAVVGADLDDGPLVVRVALPGRRLRVPDEAHLEWIRLPEVSWEVPVGASGLWELNGLPSRVGLRVELERGRRMLRRADLALDPGELRDLDWRLGAGATIRGRVVRAVGGEPVARCTVWLSRKDALWEFASPHARARTDAEGRFHFADVTAGTWFVGVPPRRRVTSDQVGPVSERVEVVPGARELAVTLAAPPGLMIEGRVETPAGEPLKNASLSAGFVHARTGADGRFVLGPLAPGDYVLAARVYGGEQASSEPVSVSAGATGVLLVARTGASVSGVALDASSSSPTAVYVSLLAQSGQGSFLSAPTEEDGTFRFSALAPGTYVVVAHAAGRFARSSALEIESGETVDGLTLELRPSARLRLRYEGEQEIGTFGLWANGARVHDTVVRRGTEALLDLPPGEVRVDLVDGREGRPGRVSRVVRLTAGQVTELSMPEDVRER